MQRPARLISTVASSLLTQFDSWRAGVVTGAECKEGRGHEAPAGEGWLSGPDEARSCLNALPPAARAMLPAAPAAAPSHHCPAGQGFGGGRQHLVSED